MPLATVTVSCIPGERLQHKLLNLKKRSISCFTFAEIFIHRYMIKVFIWVIVMVMTISCNSNSGHSTDEAQQNNSSIPKTRSDSLYKAAMEGHDAGMAKMGEIARYQKLVKQKIDSVGHVKNKAKLQPPLDSALHALQYAEELMNRWMQDFDPDKAGRSEAEKVSFYSLEKEKIDTVNARIFESIAYAKQVMQQLPVD